LLLIKGAVKASACGELTRRWYHHSCGASRVDTKSTLDWSWTSTARTTSTCISAMIISCDEKERYFDEMDPVTCDTDLFW